MEQFYQERTTLIERENVAIRTERLGLQRRGHLYQVRVQLHQKKRTVVPRKRTVVPRERTATSRASSSTNVVNSTLPNGKNQIHQRNIIQLAKGKNTTLLEDCTRLSLQPNFHGTLTTALLDKTLTKVIKVMPELLWP